MEARKVTIAVFTGTGNTLLAARALAGELENAGRSVGMAPMERPYVRPEKRALGLALPVACFSTYPTAWRFIDSLPPGEGDEAFLLGTMGGAGFGMEEPIRKVLLNKGYRPIGSLLAVMPGNYNNKVIPVDANRAKTAAMQKTVADFARALLSGTARWGGGIPLVSSFFAGLAHGRKPWRTFYRIFPLTVDEQACASCGLCVGLCPEGNIQIPHDDYNAKARIGDRCQSCQRCAAFCPAGAIGVPGKPAMPYRSVEVEEIFSLLEN